MDKKLYGHWWRAFIKRHKANAVIVKAEWPILAENVKTELSKQQLKYSILFVLFIGLPETIGGKIKQFHSNQNDGVYLFRGRIQYKTNR